MLRRVLYLFDNIYISNLGSPIGCIPKGHSFSCFLLLLTNGRRYLNGSQTKLGIKGGSSLLSKVSILLLVQTRRNTPTQDALTLLVMICSVHRYGLFHNCSLESQFRLCFRPKTSEGALCLQVYILDALLLDSQTEVFNA